MAVVTRRRVAARKSAPTVPVWEEPRRGEYPDPRLWLLTGKDQVKAGFAGRWAKAPMLYLTGINYADANDDGVTWEQPMSPWFLTSQGVVPGGFLAAVADCALGSVISTNLPARTPFSTSELAINFLKAVRVTDGTLIARGRQVHANQRLALSECTIEDAAGAPVLHATSRCVLGEQLPSEVETPKGAAAVAKYIESIPVWKEPRYPTPHPYLRPVVGEVLPQSTWKRMNGREILERQIDGKLPMPPIHHLTGMRPVATGTGQATFAMPASAWLTSGFGTIQGGFMAMLAYSALASAIQTTTDLHTGHVPIDLKVSFLRPAFPDSNGGELVAHGMVAHRGRNLAVADAEVLNADGKPVAVAMGTQMLLPGKPAWSRFD